MLTLVDDPSDEVAAPVIQGLGHLTLNAMSDQAVRNSLGQVWSHRERAKMYALGMTGSPGLLAIAKSTRRRPSGRRRPPGGGSTRGPAIRE